MPEYRFKFPAEAAWFVAVAVLTELSQVLLTFDPARVTDWRTWAVSLAAALVRAAAGAVLDWLRRHPTPTVGPPPH